MLFRFIRVKNFEVLDFNSKIKVVPRLYRPFLDDFFVYIGMSYAGFRTDFCMLGR